MKNEKNPEIIFLRVTDNNTKLNRIVGTVGQHYFSGDRITIFVPNQQSAEYIDQLLWRNPSDSFLPHQIASEPCSERIIITLSKTNLNQGNVAFNLAPNVCNDLNSFEKVYELSDQTDAQKAKLSHAKIEDYKKLGAVLTLPFSQSSSSSLS